MCERWFGDGKPRVDVLVAPSSFWQGGLREGRADLGAAFVSLLRGPAGKCPDLKVVSYGPKAAVDHADDWAGESAADVVAALRPKLKKLVWIEQA